MLNLQERNLDDIFKEIRIFALYYFPASQGNSSALRVIPKFYTKALKYFNRIIFLMLYVRGT